MTSFGCWDIELVESFSYLQLVMPWRALVSEDGLASHALPSLWITCKQVLEMDVLLGIDQQRWRTGPSHLCGVLLFLPTSSQFRLPPLGTCPVGLSRDKMNAVSYHWPGDFCLFLSRDGKMRRELFVILIFPNEPVKCWVWECRGIRSVLLSHRKIPL